MPNPSGYHFVLSAEVFRAVFALRTLERQGLDDTFQYLVYHPHLSGDYQEQNEEGRPREVLLRGRFLVTFWTDHAVREVRIVRVEKV